MTVHISTRQLLPNPQNTAFISKVQFDAFKAGMTRALNFLDDQKETDETVNAWNAIIEARDNLKPEDIAPFNESNPPTL